MARWDAVTLRYPLGTQIAPGGPILWMCIKPLARIIPRVSLAAPNPPMSRTQANAPTADPIVAREALKTIVPSDVHFSVWDSELPIDLYPLEQEVLARAVSSRRTQFSRGRAVARSALVAAGGPLTPIPVGANRQPVWPEGFIGSITHTAGLVAAAVAPSRAARALGLDAEQRAPLPEDVRGTVLHSCEEHLDPVRETIVFSAKESIHKALNPLADVWLDFLDVQVALDLKGSWSAKPAVGRGDHVPPEVVQLKGRYAITTSHVITICVLR